VIVDSFQLPLFLLNTLLIIADAALGYHLAPRLLKSLCDPETAAQGLRPTRSMLSVVVALSMFFNCRGYFLSEPFWLLAVPVLVLADMLLQNWLVRRNPAPRHPAGDE
jgi:hypothetical protein